MAYSVYQDVLDTHKAIPSNESAYITKFIVDADIEIDLRLGIIGYTVPFTAPIPPVLTAISKYFATYKELKRIYAKQVQEGLFEWVRDYRDEGERLLKLLEMGASINDIDIPDIIDSSTKDFTPIFDLGDVEAWAYHPDDDDLRYGEDTDS